MLLSQLVLCLMFHKSQLSTTVKESVEDFVIQPPPLRFRRQDITPPKRSDTYNPNYGYEPYWPDGSWVFNRFQTTTIEPKPDSLCGKDCPDMHMEFGELCGRDKDFNYKTFDNYCALLNEDCTGRQKWMIVYRGVCVTELPLFPTAHLNILANASIIDYIFESINPYKFKPATTSTTTKT